MSWFVLIISGVLEAVWAVALGKSAGFTRLGPSAVFAIAILASMAGLAYAMRELPVGTAYAVWVGIGAALTVAYGMVAGSEPVSAAKVALLIGLIGCIVGLKLAHQRQLVQCSVESVTEQAQRAETGSAQAAASSDADSDIVLSSDVE